MMHMATFDRKVVLITGASSGIGADAARYLAKFGAKVAIVGRNKKRLYEVAEQIKNSGARTPLPIVADITRNAERIVDETIEHFGQLDVLVNNAGITSIDNIHSIEMSVFNRIFETNTRSAIILTKLCVPHLEKTKGNVVNISSVAAISPVQNIMSYCISKAALDAFTKCAALDLAPKGIRINAINPAQIRTPIFETMMKPDEIKQMFQLYKNKYPVGRIGEVSDTSAAIGFLANNKLASFITGMLLNVDGGILISGHTSTLAGQ